MPNIFYVPFKLIIGFVVSNVLSSTINLNFPISSSEYTISYNNSNCDIILSPNVSNSIRCLTLCHTTLCKSVKFDALTDNCTLYGSTPNLIQYDSISGLNLVYVLDAYLQLGDSCLFDFTCNASGQSRCSNGFCNCFRNKSKYDKGLINEWTFNNTLLDSVQCNDLVIYPNASFTQISTSPSIFVGDVPVSGYFSAPPDIYFDGDFTVTSLVNVRSIQRWSRLIDFGNGAERDNIQLDFSVWTSGYPTIGVFNYNQYPPLPTASQPMPLNEWIHVAGVLNGSLVSLYLNGTDCLNVNQTTARGLIRTKNFIGRSNWSGDELANATYRNLRIYNRALTAQEIAQDMIQP